MHADLLEKIKCKLFHTHELVGDNRIYCRKCNVEMWLESEEY